MLVSIRLQSPAG
uniref:TMV resistance protein N-like n=1 Tax=Rhizophora mucronata TaxID=61149 RepID=A0A2P2NAW6_RHIMU